MLAVLTMWPGRPGPFAGGFQHHRREQAHAVDHAHQVDAQHPFPVLRTEFSQTRPPAPTPALLKTKWGAPKRERTSARPRLHLLGAGHIDLAGQHLRAGGAHFGRGRVERVLLHVDQHQVHAQPGANARAFQAEARAGAGQNGGLAFEIGNHGFAFLRM
jgi:hypothetical protein